MKYDVNTLPPGFWGKLDQELGTYHPLLAHCLDVAACCEALLRHTSLRSRFEKLAGRPLEEGDIARLTILAGLHDLGKFNHGFQRKALIGKCNGLQTAGHVTEALQLLMGPPSAVQNRLGEALAPLQLFGWGEAVADFLQASICHHGRPRSSESAAVSKLWEPEGDLDPFAGIRELVTRMLIVFPNLDAPPLPSSPEFVHAFSGLVMLADWLGSSRQWFPYQSDHSDRWPFAQAAARKALSDLGLDGSASVLQPDVPFSLVLPTYPPRGLQAAVGELSLPNSVALACTLAILEGATGSGKTEAALWHFLRLYQAGLVDSLYFALPTRTAATEIFRRVCEVTKLAFGDAAPPVTLAVPGYLRVDDREGKHLDRFEVLWNDDESARFRFRSWSAEHPKRFLASAIAIGTIDQVLLSSLRVSHAHMRGTSLLRSLLVVDEVHASDAYMTRLLEEVLSSHLGAGGHALLMSATLGAESRRRFAAIAGAELESETLKTDAATAFPRIEWVADGKASVSNPREVTTPKTVHFEFADVTNGPALVARAISAARAGAKTIILRNTVTECLKTQKLLELQAPDLAFVARGLSAPHHSRFAEADRRVLDEALIESFGKGRSQGGQIVVATQTIQQSLDLDADFMITDLCPIDVLLQRVGRLHRHKRDSRPAGFEDAHCVIAALSSAGELAQYIAHDGDAKGQFGFGSVYADLRQLAGTQELLEKNRTVEIPAENRWLVESALHSEALKKWSELGDSWRKHGNKVYDTAHFEKQHATSSLLNRTASFDASCGDWDSDDMPLRTRLGLDSRDVSFTPVRSPFGELVGSLSIPPFLVREGDVPDDGKVKCTATVDGFCFRVGSTAFEYSRLGLQKV